jgi:hypothetical protein
MRKAVALLFVLLALAAWPGGAMAARPVFTITGANCTEGHKCVFTITKDAKASSYSKLAFKAYGGVGAGNAHLGVDFVKTEVSVTFANTELTKKVEVQTINNGVVDGNRLLAAAIYNLRNATVAVPGATGVYIVDDDGSAPIPPATQTCPDGSVIPATDTCPATTKPCPDGSTVPIDQDCPVPPAPGWVDSPGLSGLAPIASEFDPNTTLQSGTVPASNAPDFGAFRFQCTAAWLSRNDPIVYPGQPGKSHLHQGFGNTDVNASSTYASLRAHGVSTCQLETENPANRSGYWVPALLDGIGNVIQPDAITIYYKRWHQSSIHCNTGNNYPTAFNVQGKACLPLPFGLRFLFGYNMINGAEPPTGATQFICNEQPANFETLTQALNRCRGIQNSTHAATHFMFRIEAPSCWDGLHLDSPDHRAHVSYPSYGDWGYLRCPTTHPYVIPTFTQTIQYTIAANDNTLLFHYSSDEMVAGAAPGQTAHADWFGAWDPTVQGLWSDNCLNLDLNCESGQVGDGRGIKGADAAHYWINGVVVTPPSFSPNPARVVPLSSIP